MNSTFVALAQGYAAVCAFALFFLPPGYLLAHFVNFNQFRDRSAAEKLLWSVCFAVPLSVELCAGAGRYLPRTVILLIVVTLALMAAFTAASRRIRTVVAHEQRPTRVVLLLAGILALFSIFAVTDVAIGPHLYVSTVIYDWSVRVPMVDAAMRSGVPPVNGLSALNGHPAPLRYFYYWNVVCADLAQLVHVPARASLAASSVWAAWSLLAVFFLSLKYLLGIRRNLRTHCALSFLVLGVMGLDILPTIPLYLARKLHPYAEMEWWHQDRTPSLLSTPLYSPHHIAAFACLLTGLLVLALTLRPSEASTPEASTPKPTRLPNLLFASIFAGICFGAAGGTSVFPTFTVAIVCLVWALDLLRQRQFTTLAALAGSAVVALLLAHTFLHELLATPAAASSGSFVSLAWRNASFVQLYLTKYHVDSHHVLVHQVLLQGAVLVLHLFDLGFFFFVLVHRVRRDRGRSLTPTERFTWALFVGTAIPYLFLSSSSIAAPNDLGFDAGILLRLTLQLWAVPWVYDLWQRARTHTLFLARPRIQRVGLLAASACLALGLSGELFQIVSERLYLPLVGSQILHKQLDILTTDQLSARLYNIREAYRDLDRSPAAPGSEAILQYNPISTMQMALTFYATHQIAAFDHGCGTGYGGDYKACQVIMPQLVQLYGNTLEGFDKGKAGNDRQDDAAPTIATAADAEAVCRTLHLTDLIAESTDSIWSRPTSWVWTMQPIVANPTVRIFACPSPN